jgi:hypothetical protein
MPQSSDWTFSCTYRTPNDLCFNGGNCSVNILSNGITEEFCVCPEGYTHDLDWMHFNNCAKPVNSTRDFLIFYCCVNGLLAFYYLVVVHCRLKAGAAKRIGTLNLGNMILNVAIVFGMYLQGGFFEVDCVLAPLTLSVAAHALNELIVVSLKPVYTIKRKSFDNFERRLKIWTRVCVLSQVIMMICLLATLRTASFNFVSFVFSATLYVGGAGYFYILYRSATLLSKLMDINDEVPIAHKDHWRELSRRLNLVQYFTSSFFLGCWVLIFTHPLVIWYFGSFPYFFVCAYFVLALGFAGCAGITIFIHPSRSGRNIHESTISNPHVVEVQ